MFEQTEEVISLVLTPRSRQDSFDINLSFVREFSKPKGTVIIPCDDSADEVSTLASSVASSNLCSQTFETPERSRRKRSYSDENIQMTFDDVYDRVDSFLDKEGLFIVSPSPIVARKNLKQCALTNLTGLCQTMEQNTQAGLNLLSGKDIQKSTLPGFLIKRVASSGQPAQSQPTIETKSSFNRSLVCNKNRTSTLASLRLSLA